MRSMKYLIGFICIAALLLVALSAPACAETKKAALAVTDVKLFPEVLMPGDRGTVTVTFASTLNSDSSDVAKAVVDRVAMESYGPVSIQPTSFDTSETLSDGDTARFMFQVYVDSGASDGVYYPKLTAHTKEGGDSLVYQIPIRVDSSPAKVILSQMPEEIGPDGGNVVLDVANVRSNDIDCVSVEPLGDFVFQPVQEYYIGSIGPGESYTVEFDVRGKDSSYNSTPSFKLRYKNGDNWHETAPLTVQLTTAMTVTESTEAALVALVVLIVAVTVICGGVYLVMRRKRSSR